MKTEEKRPKPREATEEAKIGGTEAEDEDIEAPSCRAAVEAPSAKRAATPWKIGKRPSQ